MGRLKQGIFATYKGNEYKVSEDIDWDTLEDGEEIDYDAAGYCIITRDSEKADETFVYDEDWKGYRKHIEPEELENVVYVSTEGILNGYTVGICAEDEENNLLLASDFTPKAFEGHNYRNVEPGVYEAWVDADEIEIVIVSEPHILGGDN